MNAVEIALLTAFGGCTYLMGRLHGWMDCMRYEARPAIDKWQGAVTEWGLANARCRQLYRELQRYGHAPVDEDGPQNASEHLH